MSDHCTYISSEHRLLDLNLKEVWQYRDLILLFTRRNFVVTYKQTVLGPIWIFLNPLISSIIYAVIFGGIAGIATDGVPELLFYLCGTAVWNFFSSSLSYNATTFTSNAGVFGKVYFPRLTIPISNVLSAAIRFCVQMLLTFVFLLFYMVRGAVSPNWGWWLMIPVILLHLGLLGLGCGIIVSSLTTKYRDLVVLVGFGVQLWMYATPVVYPMSQVSGLMKTVLMLNPATAPVELFRYAILGVGSVNWLYYGISWIFTIVVAFLGIIIFNRVEKTFMDTV